MSQPTAPDHETPAASPLDAAASRGPLHWTSDPEVDPAGVEDPVGTGSTDQQQEIISFNLRR